MPNTTTYSTYTLCPSTMFPGTSEAHETDHDYCEPHTSALAALECDAAGAVDADGVLTTEVDADGFSYVCEGTTFHVYAEKVQA